jgi:DNA-binding MarR family transcriptional regulator
MEILSGLQHATHTVGAWIEASLRDEAISPAEANILDFLSSNVDSTINHVHHHFGHRRSTLTNVIDRLEGRGLLVRLPNPESRRTVRLELSDQGRQVAGDVRELVRWLEGELWDRVTPDDMQGFERVLLAIEQVAG